MDLYPQTTSNLPFSTPEMEICERNGSQGAVLMGRAELFENADMLVKHVNLSQTWSVFLATVLGSQLYAKPIHTLSNNVSRVYTFASHY